ncbi:NUC189-domain-containing protein [Cystobasidium minutum MCA 4210]|uniref:NUC189-domain-containing protein n=1 Tax=Cystobasidium minutum MCA 4210 TaxID=1397322 RepID=UPI0034CFA0E2|eukprot:jgi/Rhomi1/20347/CE20346_752
MGKKAGKQAQSHNDRAKTTSTLSQPAALDMSSIVTRFSPSGRLFAQLSIAVDADTLRVYEVSSGQCVGRWASSSANERVSSLEWAELPSSSSSAHAAGDEKPNRGRKRRKGTSSSAGDNIAADQSISKDGDSSIIIQDSAATASTSAAAANTEEASTVPTMEVIALGLKNASILILHLTQSTVIQIISHPSITSPPISLSYPSSSSQQSFLLWSCTANGQLSAWSLPRLTGTKGKLVAQYDTNCSSCSTVSVRYISSSSNKPLSNGSANHENTASTHSSNGTTVQVLLGQFSIKLFEMPLPSTKHSLSEGFERPRIHLRSEASGHASEVAQTAWLNGEVLAPSKDTTTPQVAFVSIAKGDRFVSVWSASVSSSGEGPSSGTLVATLGLDEEPRRIALSSNKSIICCISTDAARIISLDSAANAEQQGTPVKQRRRSVRSLRVLSTVSSSQAASSPCTDAFLPANPPGTICVASGVIKPALDSVSYRDQTGAYIAALQLSSRPQGALNGANGHIGAEAPRAAYSEARQSTVLSAEAARDPSIASASVAAEVDPAAEPTIAERLQELEVRDSQKPQQQQQQPGGALAVLDPATRRSRTRASGRGNIANALSTTQSLVQALHSADVRLLETCLAEKNPKVIRATVRRVPPTLVLPLVEALVERLSRRRRGAGEGSGGVDASRGQVLIEWLRNVLIVHLGYLITIPSLVERLSALHATLESRMSFHSQLLALSGRLDLVVSQIDNRAHPIQDLVQQSKASSSAAPVKNLKPGSQAVKKYVEGEESDEESSSDDDEEDEVDEDGIEAAEEGDEEDIEDLVMANGEVTADELDDDEDDEDEEDDSEEDDDDEEDDDEIPALRKNQNKSKSKLDRPKMNGFLDVEAEESENEGSDEEGNPIPSRRNRSSDVKLNGVINEDSLDEDEEDLDRYESDFINDDSEEDEEEESGDDDDEEEDDDE